jgi:hypothetical protein
MAKVVVTHITDDLDGSPDAQTVRFGYLGRNYEIDLSEANQQKLAKALAPYLEVAVRTDLGSRSSFGPPASDLDPRAVRAGAESKGITHNGKSLIGAKGRVPADIIEQYRSAHRS